MNTLILTAYAAFWLAYIRSVSLEVPCFQGSVVNITWEYSSSTSDTIRIQSFYSDRYTVRGGREPGNLDVLVPVSKKSYYWTVNEDVNTYFLSVYDPTSRS